METILFNFRIFSIILDRLINNNLDYLYFYAINKIPYLHLFTFIFGKKKYKMIDL